MTRVLVLGAGGFIGRFASRALQAQGAQVTLAGRNPDRLNQRLGPALHGLPKQRVALHELLSAQDWQPLLESTQVVLNCVGILRQRGAETYAKVHHLAPTALAQACKARNIRLVHVSALGLTESAKSGFLRSKLAGERALQQVDGDWIIVRPSLLDGPGGYGAAWLRGVAKLPLFVAPADARGNIAALRVEELGEALAHLCLKDGAALNLSTSREFELGGPEQFTFENYIRELRKAYASNRALCLPIPGLLARLGAHLCDLVHFTPFSFGHWELLRHDNTPAPNRLPELLGRAPTTIGN